MTFAVSTSLWCSQPGALVSLRRQECSLQHPLRTASGVSHWWHCQSLRPQSVTTSRKSRTCVASSSSQPTTANGNGLATAKKDGLILPRGAPGSWDSAGVGSPVVRRFLSDDEDRWYMWYSGGDGTLRGDPANARPLASASLGSTGLATSTDGVTWTRGAEGVETNARGEGGAGMVLAPSGNWWAFDTRHVTVSNVLFMSSPKVRASSGVYWMYYSGGDAEELPLAAGLEGGGKGAPAVGEVVEGLRMRPGLALSNDARNWARVEGEHHSGAILDVGEEGAFDAAMVAAPQVVFHAPGDIRMYYHSWDAALGRFRMGLARSRDGLRWIKLGEVMAGEGAGGPGEERGCAACWVVPDPAPERDGGYLMAYEAVGSDGRSSIKLAFSSDGLYSWERADVAPLLSAGEPGAWDEGGVGSPCLVDMGGGMWRLYYASRGSTGTSGIGLAEGVGPGIMSFQRIASSL